MINKIFGSAVLLATGCASSCSSSALEEVTSEEMSAQTRVVRLHAAPLRAGFTIGAWGVNDIGTTEVTSSVDAMTRGDSSGGGAPSGTDGVALGDVATRFAVADWMGSTLAGSVRQSKADADTDFGVVDLALKQGSHQLTLLAHNGTSESFNYFGISFTPVTDTFLASLTMEVSNSTKEDQTATLQRCTAALKLILTDAIPANVAKLKVTVQDVYSTVDIASGYAASSVSPASFTKEYTYQEAHVGVTNTSYTLYTFVPSEEGYTTRMTLESLDAKGETVNKAIILDVPVERNVRTTITGAFFARATTWSVTASSDWTDEKSVTF